MVEGLVKWLTNQHEPADVAYTRVQVVCDDDDVHDCACACMYDTFFLCSLGALGCPHLHPLGRLEYACALH